MMKAKDTNDKAEPYWSNLWGNGNKQRSAGMKYLSERSKQPVALHAFIKHFFNFHFFQLF